MKINENILKKIINKRLLKVSIVINFTLIQKEDELFNLIIYTNSKKMYKINIDFKTRYITNFFDEDLFEEYFIAFAKQEKKIILSKLDDNIKETETKKRRRL